MNNNPTKLSIPEVQFLEYIPKVLDFLGHIQAGGITEVRIISPERYLQIKGTRKYVGKITSGYYNDYKKLAQDILPFNGKALIYITLNPCKPELLARAANRLKFDATTTTTDNDILCDLWFPIDADPVRATGISSTDEEFQAALKKRDEICQFFSKWAVMVKAISGNGGHGLIKLPGYPNIPEIRAKKEQLEKFIANKFTDWDPSDNGNMKTAKADGIKVDSDIFNMARIWKLYGTIATKGDEIPGRPHRESSIEMQQVKPVDLYAILDQIIPPEKKQSQTTKPNNKSRSKDSEYPFLDVPAYLNNAGYEWRTKKKGNSIFYQFKNCPVHSDMDGDSWECAIIQDSNGKMGGKCYHDSNIHWEDFKTILGDPKQFYEGHDQWIREHSKNKAKQTKKQEPREKVGHDIDSGPGKYYQGDKLNPILLAEEIMQEQIFLYSGSILYGYLDGVFIPMAEELISMECRKRLVNLSRINYIKEVCAHIKDLAYRDYLNLNPRAELINLKNGMLDWESGELLEHSPEYLSTIRIPVKYDVNALCPAFDKYLSEVLPADTIQLIYELFGYCMIPDTRFKKAFMLNGPTNSGKSILIECLARFIGLDNTSSIALHDIAQNRFMIAQLAGKLINTFADLDNKDLEATGLFKCITSGDLITADVKNRKPFHMKPFSRLIFSANKIPNTTDNSSAYFDRWIIIQFPNSFSGNKADKNLLSKITTDQELSGICNKAINGLKTINHNNIFSISQTSENQLNDYRYANDTVGAFIELYCIKNGDIREVRGKLYAAYLKFCKDREYEILSDRAFYNGLRALGFSDFASHGERYFKNLKLKFSIAGDSHEVDSGNLHDLFPTMDNGD